MQVEQKCQIPRPAPKPQPGALPLPSSLDRAALDFQASRVEDLNSLMPEGILKLSTPQPDPNVMLCCHCMFVLMLLQMCGHASHCRDGPASPP